MGASGTCCCAAIPEVRTTPVPRNAANAITLERNFTAISSSLKRLSQLQNQAANTGKPHPTEYQTHQSLAGCLNCVFCSGSDMYGGSTACRKMQNKAKKSFEDVPQGIKPSHFFCSLRRD
jgi:hypothetical protein